MLTDKHMIPPTPLWVQLYEAKEFNFDYRQLSRETGVPYRRIDNVVAPRGRLEDFLKVVRGLGLRIRITTWEGKQLVPLDDSIDFQKLCQALTVYKDYCFRGGMHMRLWPSFKRRAMVECAFEDATLEALDRYLEHIHAHAVLVRVLGDEDGIDRAAA